DALVGMHAAELAELVPELRARLPAGAIATRDRFALFEGVGAMLHAAALRMPRVLVFDDLHAADPSSLQLVHFLVRGVRAAPLLVIGTYREAEVRIAPETSRVLAQIGREATTLHLRRFDRAAVGEFVARATGDA